MSASALDKILKQGQAKGSRKAPVSSGDDELRTLVQAASVALTGACGTENPAMAAELVLAAAATVEALADLLYTQSLPVDQVAATMAKYGVDGYVPAETVGLSVLTAEGRRRAASAGYTIGDSEDYPIPDKGHLGAAVARYKQGKFAGHPASTVKAHILKHAHRLGVEVDLVAAPVLSQIRDGEATVYLAGAAPPGDIPMHHAPFTGTHEHAHSVTMTHGHAHSHQDDNSHGSPVHGNNASGQKSWAAKGQSRRMDY